MYWLEDQGGKWRVEVETRDKFLRKKRTDGTLRNKNGEKKHSQAKRLKRAAECEGAVLEAKETWSWRN
jgi:hypothetical protein